MRPKVSLSERFALNLRRLLGRADLTQAELAVRAELHRSEIGELERGKRLPRIDTLAKLAGGLDLAFDFPLLDGIEWRPAGMGAGYFYAMDRNDERSLLPGRAAMRPRNRWWEEILRDLGDSSLDDRGYREIREQGLVVLRAIASGPTGELREGLLRALSREEPEREGHLGRLVGHMASEGLIDFYGERVLLTAATRRFGRIMQAAHELRYRRP